MGACALQKQLGVGNLYGDCVSEVVRNGLIDDLLRVAPNWQVVPNYRQLVCCIPVDDSKLHSSDLRNGMSGSCESDHEFLQRFLKDYEHSHQWRIIQERHKFFMYPSYPDKLGGVRALGVVQLDVCAGDDCQYDQALLEQSCFPLTVRSAPAALRRVVTERNGVVIDCEGHLAAVALLEKILELVESS